MALVHRLLTFSAVIAASIVPVKADLQVALQDAPGASASVAAANGAKKNTSKPAARAKTKPVGKSSSAVKPARRGELASRSMPQQVGVARRGGPPVLPPIGATSLVPESAQAEPASSAQVAVNARLGRMIAYATEVYKLPDPRSQWVGRLMQGQQVAIVSQWEGWYAVVMGNGSQAYVPKTSVEVLPYQVKSVTPVAPKGAPTPTAGVVDTAGGTGAGGAAGFARALIQEAFKYEGMPYVYGGNGEGGIDCSGLVKNCYRAFGLNLPRRASEQAQVGQPVALDQLQPGDRLYFSVKRQFDHTGIYLGNGYFIHASGSRKKVTIDHLSTALYGKNLESARRF